MINIVKFAGGLLWSWPGYNVALRPFFGPSDPSKCSSPRNGCCLEASLGGEVESAHFEKS